MKQAYVIEIDDDIPLKDIVKRLQEINSGESDFIAFDYALGEVTDALGDAVLVEGGIAGITFRQSVGTIEQGATVTGVSIGRLG